MCIGVHFWSWTKWLFIFDPIQFTLRRNKKEKPLYYIYCFKHFDFYLEGKSLKDWKACMQLYGGGVPKHTKKLDSWNFLLYCCIDQCSWTKIPYLFLWIASEKFAKNAPMHQWWFVFCPKKTVSMLNIAD